MSQQNDEAWSEREESLFNIVSALDRFERLIEDRDKAATFRKLLLLSLLNLGVSTNELGAAFIRVDQGNEGPAHES